MPNEHELGNDPNYFDVSRDLLQMVNGFREQMPCPFFGMVHSSEGTSLTHLTFIHPRLFSSLIMIEPAIYSDGNAEADKIKKFTVLKPDFWKSREELEAWARGNALYRNWDPRVVDRLLRY